MESLRLLTNKSNFTGVVALDMLKIFVSLCYAGVLHKLRSVGIFGQVMASFHYSALINSFTRFRILVILQGTRTSLIQYQVLGY